MSSSIRSDRQSAKTGVSPDTPMYIGTRSGSVGIEAMCYSADGVTQVPDPVALNAEGRGWVGNLWVNVEGVHDPAAIESIGMAFGLHPLTVEDILNTRQRPKLEDYDDYLFIVMKMLRWNNATSTVESEQVSLILQDRLVLCFQEGAEGDVFDQVRQRISSAKSRVRQSGADFLCYSLIDAVVDQYFIILEEIGERIELLEDDLVSNPTPETLQGVHNLKRVLISLRKSVWPLREVIGVMHREESELITEHTSVYLRDVYDHTIQVIDTLETYRDMLAGMLDMYMSSVSNRMNEVMKVLTMIATVFIPLTFLAGVYGMNFEFMPELRMPWAYPVLWVVMIVISAIMLLWFRRKRWL